MEESVIVLMLKNKETGILEKEIGCYRIQKNDFLIYNAFAAAEQDGGITAHLRLTCDRNVADWEFSAIYDYYDIDLLLSECDEVLEITDYYNPTWEVVFALDEDNYAVEARIASILSTHKKELEDVYKAIEGREEEYNAL